MNQSILITGANGFVGNALTDTMLDAGYSLICPTRRPLSRQHPALQNPQINALDKHTDWLPLLQQSGAVIHCAARVHVMRETVSDPLAAFRAVNVDATVHLAQQAAAAGVKHFIFLSSVKVNGESTLPDQPFQEQDIADQHDPYGLSKLEAEKALLAVGKKTSMAVTIIRPPLVYGPGVKANFQSMLQWVKRGVPLPLGRIHNQRSLVFVGNLVHFILHCLYHPKARQEIFQISDGHDLSTTELLEACAVALQTKSRLWKLSPNLLTTLAKIAGKQAIAQRLCGSLQVDISKARHLLEWNPPFSVAEGLAITVAQESDKK
ncbi:UDP-glucose 4-epimerase family protein [Undibacterium squillarum]|uniref:UDP-glucose 4-epimerase n=1 Tax=Undibacterium squillarum TaxID=1131567 RepID=A0ABQ2XYA7_9BURK|nr:SDR family oxidoreductase [Undibacterium squillarum]GGX40831.1 UDP-glucose 4-epimerase [Undibacterium squillarum]